MALAAFLCCLTIGAAQGRVTSIENVDGRIWMCVAEGGRLLLSYSDGGAFKAAHAVAPAEKENASFGQFWLASDGILRLFLPRLTYTLTAGESSR